MQRIRCIFPTAIKPWQKVACATVGVGIFGGTLTSTLYIIRNQTLTSRENNTKTLDNLLLGGATSMSSFACVGSAMMFYDEIKFLIKKVKGETHCCNIIRSTLLSTTKSSFMLAGVGIFGTMSWFFINEIYKNKIKTKECDEK